jgi:hypothetical protein
MAKLNLSQAAKAVGKNRTTIWRHIKSGKLSCEKDIDDMPLVDTSELLRVYGEIKNNATPTGKDIQHQATQSYSTLISVIEDLRKEQSELKSQINELSRRLTYTSQKKQPETQTAESDPDWPKEIKTMADIAKRNDLKKKYS